MLAANINEEVMVRFAKWRDLGEMVHEQVYVLPRLEPLYLCKGYETLKRGAKSFYMEQCHVAFVNRYKIKGFQLIVGFAPNRSQSPIHPLLSKDQSQYEISAEMQQLP